MTLNAALADMRLCRHARDAPILVQMRPDPVEQSRNMRARRRRQGALDELRLAAIAVGRDHQTPRHAVRGLCAIIAAHQMDTQIEPRRTAGRGHHRPLIDVKRIRQNRDLRKPGGEPRGVMPVRRGPFPVEQPTLRQHKGSAADRNDP
nr:hypothetical protein [Sinirhodobacter populi]